MKRNVFFALLGLLAFVPFVSAQYYGGSWYGTEQVIDSLVTNLEPLLRALLGGYDWTGYLLFEKTLLFILISIIVGVVLKNLPFFQGFQHKGILRLVAVIIGLLGVRNLNYIWIGTILVQYEVLFIAIAGVLPFMIYWYFIKGFDGWLRKASWIVYAVIYFGLWATTTLESYSEVYLFGALAALIWAFFIDTWFTNWLKLREIKISQSETKWATINDLNDKINKFNQSNMPESARKAAVKRLESTRDAIIKSL
jgi:hypothetical protein